MHGEKCYTLILLMLVWALSTTQPASAAQSDETVIPSVPGSAVLEQGTLSNNPSIEEGQGAGSTKVKQMSLLALINKGGIVGYLIILLSIIAGGLIIDYSLTIRKSKILPDKDVESLKTIIKKGGTTDLPEFEKGKGSFISRVVTAGLRESQSGYPEMLKAMEDTIEAASGNISRKIEHLNVIGNIAPMMGLLGTVIGMLRCFNEITHVAGVIDPKQLAGGIFEALVTTCMGLVVAIPSLYSYAIFRNRVEEFTGKAAHTAVKLVAPFKPLSDGK